MFKMSLKERKKISLRAMLLGFMPEIFSLYRYVTGSSMHAVASSLTCYARMAKIPPSSPSPVRLVLKVKATYLM